VRQLAGQLVEPLLQSRRPHPREQPRNRADDDEGYEAQSQ
jgi:hypothetical protein